MPCRRTLLALLALLPLATSCGADQPAVHAADQGVTATASRLHVRHFNGVDMIAGQLTVRGNSQTLLTADLECFWLSVGANKSSSVWVDSFVDIQRGDYPAQNGTVSVGVYWAMKKFEQGTNADLKNLTLSIKHPFSASCFNFAPAEKESKPRAQ